MSLLSNFLSVFEQVMILFILMALGAVLARLKKIDGDGIRQMTFLLLIIVTFCIVVNAFATVEYSQKRIQEMLVVALFSVLTVLLGALVARPIFHKGSPRHIILRFGISFTNCGFMSIPLADALLGAEGVFLVSIYMAVFQVLAWTYGVSLYTPHQRRPLSQKLKKALINPGVIGIAVGLPLFLFRLPLPKLILSPIGLLSGLNTPLAMVLTGALLAKSSLRYQPGDRAIFGACALRLIAVPVILFVGLYVAGVRGLLLTACIIPISAPTASNTALFAAQFGSDSSYASRLVFISTALSMITMPLLIALAQSL